jgi:predicted dehydrogenase
VGVLGLGYIGRAIAEDLSESPRFRIVAAFDPANPADTPYPMLRSAREVVEHSDVDLVYVASPPRRHAEGVELAVEAHKAILCEKPLAPTVAEADRLATLVLGAGLPNAINFAFPTVSTGRALAEAVDRALLGPVRSGSLVLRFRRWPQAWHASAGPWLSSPDEGGFTREVGTHFLALADRLLGPGTVRVANVERGPDGLESRVEAALDFGGVPFTVDAGFDETVDRPDDMTALFTLECADGTMAIENWTTPVDIPVDLPDGGGLAPTLAALLDGQSNDLRDFAAGARVVRLIEAILAS